MAASPTRPRARRTRVRMTSAERREQLIAVSRELFAAKGFEGTSVEEIAASAGVSKPVVYEHFGGKEGAYAVVVDRETRRLHDAIRVALTTTGARSRELLELGALALLDYIDECPDGFRILARDSSATQPVGSFASILSDIAAQVEDILAAQFKRRGHDPQYAGLYAQALVGLVAQTGHRWLEDREPDKEIVARHLINLAWNGMAHLKPDPQLIVEKSRAARANDSNGTDADGTDADGTGAADG